MKLDLVLPLKQTGDRMNKDLRWSHENPSNNYMIAVSSWCIHAPKVDGQHPC